MSDFSQRIRAGDAAALDKVFRQYFSELCRIAFRYVRSRTGAEDVVHDVFVQLWADRATLRVRTTLQAYLHGAVRNRAISVLRREIIERRWRAGAEAASASEPEYAVNGAVASLASAEAARMVSEVLAALPERCREAAVLRWERQLSLAEIATVMGIAVKTVQVHLTRAYGALRASIAESPAD